ncbi:TonB-dependent receptor plug domain-containing protein [Flavihumibacter petaseus]|uniref:Putative TonB-dependent receptor n=1 Tax=Flavihumibacter petaseus NBRC 106054 TaxID=1220578 RepID=A0A0E9N520_9BACT|nr:carboxypeptidase-like regulatory domain-containing protein [Flavihumibacter petaseus]GAO44888.1 putative TonB-dependent receptor [Flavihumibacter petaseus NBRC 106054]
MIAIFLNRLFTVILLFHGADSGNNDPDPLAQLLAKVSAYHRNFPGEKVFVQFDRTWYSAGDTVFFKLYTVTAEKHEPTAISRIAYLDCYNSANEKIRSMTLAVSDGIAYGSIPLDGKLITGPLRFVAYTAWMRNFNPVFFFDRTMRIAAVHPAKKNQPEAAPNETSVFIEGNNLINGQPARIAFRSSKATGWSVPAAVTLVDNLDRIVTTATAGHAGIGHFDFLPQADRQYKIIVRYPDNSIAHKNLPAAAREGYTLAIRDGDSGKLVIRVAASFGTAGKPYILIAQQQGKVVYIARNTADSAGITAVLSKRRFAPGILQWTLFDQNLHPVAERMVFIPPRDSLQFNLEPDKPIYATRSKVTCQLTVNDHREEPVLGSFSVSVTSVKELPAQETRALPITAAMLLLSDVTDYIENIHHYFPADGSTVPPGDLDDLMLTHNWKQIPWKQLLSDSLPPVSHLPEQSLFISGTLISKNRQPAPNGKVSLVSTSGTNIALDTIANEEGRFRFGPLSYVDSLTYEIQGAPASGSSPVYIVPDTIVPFKPGKNPAPLTDDADTAFLQFQLRRQEVMALSGKGKGADDVKLLKAVEVKGKKLSATEEAVAPSSNLNGPGKADQVVTYQQLEYCHDFGMCAQGLLRGVIIKNVLWPPGDRNATPVLMAYSSGAPADRPMLIIRDGVELPLTQTGTDLRNINGQDIQSIEVLRSGAYTSVYGSRGAYGIIIITTKTGAIDYNAKQKQAIKNVVKSSATTGAAQGYYLSPAFRGPDYSAVKMSPAPDFRTTLYWEPNLVTDDQGKATFSFFHSDEKGRFRITIEGITESGKTGRKVFYYEVK